MIARACAALLVLLALTAAAPQPRTTLGDVEDEVMCTVCGVPLYIAEAPQADRERELIRRLVAQGRTKDEIKAALVDEYGPAVLAMPPAEGFGWAAFLVPLAAGAVGLAAVVLVARRWRRRPAAPGLAGGPDADADDDALRRVDAELAALDR